MNQCLKPITVHFPMGGIVTGPKDRRMLGRKVDVSPVWARLVLAVLPCVWPFKQADAHHRGRWTLHYEVQCREQPHYGVEWRRMGSEFYSAEESLARPRLAEGLLLWPCTQEGPTKATAVLQHTGVVSKWICSFEGIVTVNESMTYSQVPPLSSLLSEWMTRWFTY